jgi:hypothetical protein
MKKQKKGCWKIMIGKREEEGTVKFSRCCDNTKRNPNADLDKNGLEYNMFKWMVNWNTKGGVRYISNKDKKGVK